MTIPPQHWETWEQWSTILVSGGVESRGRGVAGLTATETRITKDGRLANPVTVWPSASRSSARPTCQSIAQTKPGQDGSHPEGELSPKTGYESAGDSRQVPSPIVFPKTEQLEELTTTTKGSMTIEEKIEALRRTIEEESKHVAELWSRFETLEKVATKSPAQIANDEWYKAHCEVESMKSALTVLEKQQQRKETCES